MGGHHFISYSAIEAQDFAVKLYDALLAGSDSFSPWLDKEKSRPAEDWDEQIAEAIRTCASLLFVMTPDSVDSLSVVKNEWTRALRYKKPIIPLLLDRNAEMPFRLGSRQYIDFTGSFDVGLARLRDYLRWLDSPAGELQTLKYRLQDAQRDLRRAGSEERTRIQDEIDALQQQIADQENASRNPQEAKVRIEESIARGVEREREPEELVSGATHTKFINDPPIIAPSYFQNRHVETELIGDFLKEDALRMIAVVGRGGIGKTAMVCRLLKSLEGGQLPDDGEHLSVDGIIYLSETGSREVSVPYMYADLARLLPNDVAESMDKLYKKAYTSVEAKMHALLEALPTGRYVLLLDNFESVIEIETREIKDAELEGALHALLEHPQHGVKVIVTTRLPLPEDLATVRPERQRRIDLDEGLESPYAENILRKMDADGKVGLKTAPDELLSEARERTRGFPRALEHLFAILSADRATSLRDILEDTKALLPAKVVEVLVGEAFSRLDPVAQLVMQALAIYSYPVTPAAVDYLLLPYRTGGVDSAPVLRRLVNMQFVRREAGRRYYLHPVDRDYALSRVPEDEVADRYQIDAPPFTLIALRGRAADYLKQTRTPRESWKRIDDLAPQLQEFELRYAGQDYETAASVLVEIDSDYLRPWAHYRLAAEMHERLQGNLNDPYLQGYSLNSLGLLSFAMGRYRDAKAYHEQALDIARELGDRVAEENSIGNIGNVYYMLGQSDHSIEYYKQALDIAREVGSRNDEGVWLGNLGNGSADLGQFTRAIDYYEQALDIAHAVGDRIGEGNHLGNIGNRYADLGQFTRAIDCYEQALDITREVGNRADEDLWLGNLGSTYANLGQFARAKELLEQSLDIAREIGDRRMEARNLMNFGQLFIRRGEWNKAEQQLKRSISVADEIEEKLSQRDTRMYLARGYLYAGDLPSARTAIDEARQYESQGYDYDLMSLAGMIALRTGDSDAAQEALRAAVAQAEAQLSYSEQVYGALDAKGLSLCGLALATGDKDFIPPAIDAYRKAREITKAPGIVADVLRLFDALQEADAAGVLAEVREAAAEGIEANSTREA